MIRTGGGRFRPQDRHLNFLAGDRRVRFGAEQHGLVLVPCNLLNPSMEALVVKMLDDGCDVLLDSGVFSLAWEFQRAHPDMNIDEVFSMSPGEFPGFDVLWERYLRVVKAHGERLWGYVEIDVGDTDDKRASRQRMHDEGLNPIPVYHPLRDDPSYFDELATTYDRLCWANMADGSATRRKRLTVTAWERHRRYPDLWIHLLGFTPNDWAVGWAPDSCDSSTWLGSVRWGHEKGSAHLNNLGHLPDDFTYALGDKDGANKATLLAAASAHMNGRAWQSILGDLEELGLTDVPALEGTQP